MTNETPALLSREQMIEHLKLVEDWMFPEYTMRRYSRVEAHAKLSAVLAALRAPERETPADLVAREFIAYYGRGGGCSNCGGLPHSSTCFVGRFAAALETPNADR